MKQLLFPIVIIRLTISLLAFLSQLAWHLHSTLIIAGLALFLALANSFSYLSFQKTTNPPPQIIRQDQEFLENELNKQLFLLESHPTHRDVLYNLSVIYEKLGDQEKSEEFLEKAKYQDPNHPLF